MHSCRTSTRRSRRNPLVAQELHHITSVPVVFDCQLVQIAAGGRLAQRRETYLTKSCKAMPGSVLAKYTGRAGTLEKMKCRRVDRRGA